MELSKEQERSVSHRGGPALCIAGPGSGKTRVILSRVCRLIDQGVRPESVLVVTFAKAAARQMEQRFSEMSGIRGVTFSTIHSLCYSIINADNSEGTRLLPDAVKKRVLQNSYGRYCRDRGREENRANDTMLREISMEISRFKSFGGRKKDYETHFTDSDLFFYILPEFENYLLKNHYYDFDDMTDMAERSLRSNGKAKRLVAKFSYILTDEFQDTSQAQLELLYSVLPTGNIFCVGDDDQSVYSFRGASPEIFSLFKKIYPQCRIFFLSDNYRCARKITEAAGRLIVHNKLRFSKDIRAVRADSAGESFVRILEYDTENEELEALAKFACEAESKKSLAILTRTNFEAELAAVYLKRAGVEAEQGSLGRGVFDSPIVTDIISFMYVAADFFESTHLANVIRCCAPSIPSQVCAACSGADTDSAFYTLYEYARYDDGLLRELNLLRDKLSILSGMNPSSQIMFIRKSCGLDKYYERRSNENETGFTLLMEKADALAELAKSFSTTASFLNFEKDLRDEVEVGKVGKVGKTGKEMKGESNIKIMTMHSSKGLEFDHVWILNANEGMIPFRKTIESGDIEEERRLFYVAMTRARERLYISYHHSFGSRRTERSRFIGEMQET